MDFTSYGLSSVLDVNVKRNVVLKNFGKGISKGITLKDDRWKGKNIRACLLTDPALHLWWLTNSIEDNDSMNDENEKCLSVKIFRVR